MSALGKLAASARTTLNEGRFAVELAVPEDIHLGRHYVRVWVTGAGGAAMGARAVEVKE